MCGVMSDDSVPRGPVFAIRRELLFWESRCTSYEDQLRAMEERATPDAIETMRGFLESAKETRDGLIVLLASMGI